MKTPLIAKGSSFNQTHEDLVLRVQSIRRKNDQYQRLIGEEIDSMMAQEILDEKCIMDKQIEQTKNIIEEMEQISKEPQHRNRLRETKKQYEKQSSRFKQISQALMQKSVIRAEMRDSVNRRRSLPANGRNSQQKYKQVRPNRDSAQVAQQQELDIDYTMEHNILMDRKKQLIKTEEHMHRVNALHRDMSDLVNDQGNMVDVIGEEMLKARQNVQATNEQLVSAQNQQKKSRKKCYIILSVMILLIIALLGVYFILDTGKS